MNMTFNDYIQNPMGIKNAVFSQREMFRGLYTDKLNKILLRETGRVKYFLYTKGENYLIHVKVPSEIIENFYYDTVIEFYTDNENIKLSNQLNDYFVKFYSNDPAFVYTFAHAFLKNDLFIKDLEPKMSKLAIENRAKIRNPKDVVGYVKSLYFAWLIIKNYGLMKKIIFDTYGQPYKKELFLQTVEQADSKIQKRKDAALELGKRKQIERKKEINKKEGIRNLDLRSNSSKNINTVSTIKSTVKNKFINKVGSVKRK